MNHTSNNVFRSRLQYVQFSFIQCSERATPSDNAMHLEFVISLEQDRRTYEIELSDHEHESSMGTFILDRTRVRFMLIIFVEKILS